MAVSGAVKKSGHMRIWATAGRARGAASVMARLLWLILVGGESRREVKGKKLRLGEKDDGKRNCNRVIMKILPRIHIGK